MEGLGIAFTLLGPTRALVVTVMWTNAAQVRPMSWIAALLKQLGLFGQAGKKLDVPTPERPIAPTFRTTRDASLVCREDCSQERPLILVRESADIEVREQLDRRQLIREPGRKLRMVRLDKHCRDLGDDCSQNPAGTTNANVICCYEYTHASPRDA